ncbi:MAG: antitoxin [Candidatus Coatesbacteria bacterium]
MSKRLQVLLPPADMHRLKRLAQVKGVTVATWVREAIRKASLDQPEDGADRKLAALRAAVRHSFPTADIGRMLSEIERGRSRGAAS